MKFGIVELNKFLFGCFCLLIFQFVKAKQIQKYDSITVNDFNLCVANDAKLNALIKDNSTELCDFIKRYPSVFDAYSNKVIHGNDDYDKYQLQLMNAMINFKQSHYQKAIPLFLDILNQKRFISFDDSVTVLVNLKTSYGRILNYSKVFELHKLLMKMVKRFPELNNRDLGLPLSHVYIKMGLITEGINFLRAEFQSESKQKDEFALPNFYNNLGVVWLKGNNPDSAIFYYKKSQAIVSKKLASDPNNKYCIFFDGLLSGNIGQALLTKHKVKQAIPLLTKDIRCSFFTGNMQNAAITFHELARCYFENKQYQLAETYLDSSQSILMDIDAPMENLKNLKLRAALLSRLGNYKEGLLTLEKYNALNDSIAATEKELLLLNQQISFQTKDLEEKVKMQEQELAAKQLTEEKTNMQRMLMFLLLVLLIAILIFGYFSFLKSKRREKSLSEMNEEITEKSNLLEATLKEKELLIKEVHHRVKNNMQIVMSLLKLQAEKINDKHVEVYFAEARNRIQSMALVHEFLYKKDKMDFMQMDEYIKQLILEIQNSYAQPNHIIQMHTNLDPIKLDFDTSIPLGLIINELVTNSYKHAFPSGVGDIYLSFKEINNICVLSLKDNGVGLPKNFEEKKENSLGMELIHLLSQQINATLDIKLNGGFEVNITFSSAQTMHRN